MPFGMTGQNPIEFYYPDREFGALNIKEQDNSTSSTYDEIEWLSPAILNKDYNETFPNRPIYEKQRFLRDGDTVESCSMSVRLRATYVSQRGSPPTSGGSLKFAIVSGTFPPSLTLNIDTGNIFGRVDDLDDIFPEEFGVPPEGLPEDPLAEEAKAVFGFDYGEQGPKKFTEDNYAVRGSASLHRGGFGIDKDIVFTARAFDSSAPTSRYIDGVFTIKTLNNWSSDRDEFILNIRNQFFIDGKPVTNEEYLTTMKERGYFSDNCP